MEDQNKDTITDERSITNDEVEVIDSADQETTESTETDSASTEELKTENEALKAEKDEVFNRLLRLQAEYDNFKKRSQKEKEAERKYKSQDLINELLPALDNFERALQVEVTEANASLFDGITMVYRQFQDALKSQGVEVIETEGKAFDPTLHHAVMQIEDEEIESNTVVEELQKGYLLKDRVIRPAMVKVNK
ncbi:nucleotide exchange factor GrpE [Oceanobacillus profundus]|uniref:nucleotide exchange factor GrpE n=1 Tax=Oceanobacillus TaxID=182709 RepID=UPI002040EB08|nr:nucleotide exchange factor GrpE [Oceanobacillus profundus]MCM3396871.1 nucleotide exchange factor GrpE [Oceanobacillus profundus]MDO6448171.1 nucleotide exchange factor GrpE [Oceanobacillus profundus]